MKIFKPSNIAEGVLCRYHKTVSNNWVLKEVLYLRKIQVAILVFLVVFAVAWLMAGVFLFPSADVQRAEEGVGWNM